MDDDWVTPSFRAGNFHRVGGLELFFPWIGNNHSQDGGLIISLLHGKSGEFEKVTWMMTGGSTISGNLKAMIMEIMDLNIISDGWP